tara:strand:- start:6830 stop:7048 length:219 start_codon:yes stop_codon:yes gene_type:complete
VREVIKGKKQDPEILSLITVYSLAKALAISPLEIYKMPQSLVSNLLIIHTEIETLKAEEMDKISKEMKTTMR